MTDMLTEAQWELLAEAELPLYTGMGSVTGMLCREDCPYLVAMWDNAAALYEIASYNESREITPDDVEREAARRVALANLLIATGSLVAPA